MRASCGVAGGDRYEHVCGAERLVPEADAAEAGQTLMQRALSHGAGIDNVQITFERVPLSLISQVRCLDVTSVSCEDSTNARVAAEALLRQAGVSNGAIAAGFEHLQYGNAGQGRRLAGAVLISATTGGLLFGQSESGIRASHFDFAPCSRQNIIASLCAADMGHHRTREALALATKVIASGMLAELCWSDDPEYDTGYISSLSHGYVRLCRFKPTGAVGGRVFYVKEPCQDIGNLISRLKSEPLLIEGPVNIRTVKASEGTPRLSL